MSLLQPLSKEEIFSVQSVRWNEARKIYGDDVIPLSAADMDFAAPRPVIDAVVERAKVGDYCYTDWDDDYLEAVSHWFAQRHHWNIGTDEIVPIGRMVEALYAILREMFPAGTGIIVPMPTYAPTPTAVVAADCKVIPWNLVQDENGTYRFDFSVFEELLDQAKAIVITNPHNPTGRVWTKDELATIAKLADKHGVLVISDEFHGDLILPGHVFQPYLTCAEEAKGGISFTSLGKTFNLAGLESANVIVPDKALRAKVRKAVFDAGCHNPRYFARAVTIAAYGQCVDWLDELMELMAHHVDLMRECIGGIKGASLVEPEGTYLSWVDLRGTGLSDKEIVEHLGAQKLVVDPGTGFWQQGSGFIRVMQATPTPRFEEALDRMSRALK